MLGGRVREHQRGRRVVKSSHAVGQGTALHQAVAGLVINRTRTTRGHVTGGGTEARCIVGDEVCLPALLFDEVASNSRQEGERLDEAPSSLPI